MTVSATHAAVAAIASIDRETARLRRLLNPRETFLSGIDRAALTTAENARIAEREAALSLELRLREIEGDALLWRLFHDGME